MSAPALRGATAVTELLRLDMAALFGLGSLRDRQAPRIGAEIEFLVSDAVTRRPAPLEHADGPAATLPVLRVLAARHGWRERHAACGAPAFALPHGGELSFEPGGQLEYAAPPARTATALVADLRRTAGLLRETLGEHGLMLTELGIDPCTSLADAPLRLSHVERYREMDAYFARIGRAGARMMRQTASLQVSLDGADDPHEVWRVLTAAAPYALALFANSPAYAGAHTGHQSYRAHTWRTLDPARTGLRAATGAPDDYLAFALDAPAMLLRGPGGEYRRFRDWLSLGTVTLDDWRTHLTTLFPEVRPRGHFEVRACDVVPERWYAAPIAFFAGLAYNASSRRAALVLVRDGADQSLLVRAGICGVHDAAIRATALALFELALDGCRALGEPFMSPALVHEASDFMRTYAARVRSLADEVVSPGEVAR